MGKKSSSKTVRLLIIAVLASFGQTQKRTLEKGDISGVNLLY